MKKKLLGSNEIKHVELFYNLKIIYNNPFNSGMRSNTIFVQTNKGPKVLKIYPKDYSPETADFQARVCNHMYFDGIPTPRVLENIRGNLVTPYKNTHYIVMQYLSGTFPAKNNPKLIELTFSGLAIALKSLAKFDISNGIYEIPEIATPLNEQLEILQNKIKEKSDFDLDIIEYQERILKILEEHNKESVASSFPKQLILGDFNLESLLIQDNQISGILDFDQVRFYGKGFDFMHEFDNLYIDKKTPGLKLEERVDWNKLKQCIIFYASQDPSIKKEIPYFPLMHQNMSLRNIITTCNESFRGKIHQDYLKKMKQIYINRLEISTQLKQRFIDTLFQGCEKI